MNNEDICIKNEKLKYINYFLFSNLIIFGKAA